MIDKRLRKFATILVRYSLSLKKNDLFVISGSTLAAPLIKEVYRQAIEIGAHPFTHVGIDGLSEIYYTYSSTQQLKYVSPLSRYEIEHVDASLSIISPENTKKTAAAILALNDTVCFKAFNRVRESSITNPNTARTITLNPAPK